jgi:hypothetical protein
MGMDFMVEKNNEIVRVLGIPIDKLINIIQTLGIPTLFMCFILYLVWCYVPPVVNAHVRLLERTGDTLEKMDITLQQSNVILKSVSDVEQETKIFMGEARDSHTKAQLSLDKIESSINHVNP